jgi:hypothetical protein
LQTSLSVLKPIGKKITTIEDNAIDYLHTASDSGCGAGNVRPKNQDKNAFN